MNFQANSQTGFRDLLSSVHVQSIPMALSHPFQKQHARVCARRNRYFRVYLQQTSAGDADIEPEIPAEGWLWSRNTPLTRQSLRQQNIKPKK